MNRPERLNALTARTQVELKHAMIAAERDERVVGIILTGAGRAFSAGADMRTLGEIADASRASARPSSKPRASGWVRRRILRVPQR